VVQLLVSLTRGNRGYRVAPYGGAALGGRRGRRAHRTAMNGTERRWWHCSLRLGTKWKWGRLAGSPAMRPSRGVVGGLRAYD
jgi:hypothetical protein